MINLILIFSLLTKLLFLNQFPTGITNDELHFVLNSKSVFLNFSNLANNWNPLSFSTIPNETSSELPFIILAPIIGPLPTNLFNARLLPAILGTLLVLLFYLIIKKILSKDIALCVAFVATLNPWLFYVYRTTFDAPISIFFIFLFITLLLYLPKKISLLSTIPLIIAFYTYIGLKPIILLISLATTTYIYFFQKKQNLKNLLLINLIILITTFIYLSSIHKSTSRLGELVLPSSPVITTIVDTRRSQTLANPFTAIFTNRYTVYIEFVTSKWFNSFSPNLLFLKGDDTYTGSLQRHGYFYIFEAIFIVIGGFYLFCYHKYFFYYFLSLLIISPLPEAIRKDVIPAYVFHSSLQYPLLIILSGIGFFTVFKSIKASFLIYIISFANLLFIYFFQYPLYAPQSFSFNQRLLSTFLIAQKTSNKIYVITKEPDTAFKNYLFFSNSLNKNSFNTISHIYQQRSTNYFGFNNLIFTTADNLTSISSKDIVVVEEGVSYSPKVISNRKIIKNIESASVIYSIYNSNFCQIYSQNKPIPNISPTESSLCGAFISTAY